MGNTFVKVKRDVEGNNLELYLFRPTTPNSSYLISKGLRRLSFTFYKDTLFAIQKYIIESVFAQIFTNGEGSVYVHPMQYKSQAGGVLNLGKRDIRVPSTPVSHNAG